MLSAEKIARVRSFSFGATGLICGLYAVLVVFTQQPDPLPWWLPGSVGLLSVAIIFGTFCRAGPVPVQQATDELFKRCAEKAHRFGFWSALLLYPFFGFLISTGALSLSLAFPIMGTLTATAYLLSFVIFSEWPSAK
ncbi:MAG: hypothetical protein HOH32_10875 [Rhodobacteraceae bacterium]|jgi:hypothetical protein|nr:hypothetical protein [Paracoccaceae bacterium]